LKPVRLTLERDSAVLPMMTNTNNNNNNTNDKCSSSSVSAGDVASAAADRCGFHVETSANDGDSSDVSTSPSPSSLSRNVKRRSTVPKGFVTPSF